MKGIIAWVLTIAAAIAALGSGYYLGRFAGQLKQDHLSFSINRLHLFSLVFAPFSLCRFLITIVIASLVVVLSVLMAALVPQIQISEAVPILTAIFQGSLTAAALLAALIVHRAQYFDLDVQDHERRVNELVRSAVATPDFLLPRVPPGVLLASLKAVARMGAAGTPSPERISKLVMSLSDSKSWTNWSANTRQIMETLHTLLRELSAHRLPNLHLAMRRIEEELIALAVSQEWRDRPRLSLQWPLLLVVCSAMVALLAAISVVSHRSGPFSATGLLYFVVGVTMWGVGEMLWGFYCTWRPPETQRQREIIDAVNKVMGPDESPSDIDSGNRSTRA
jgi:hypothetical protein